MKKSSQKNRILKYLDTFGSITPYEAFANLGITKLATRISELRLQDGMSFKIELVKDKNRFGEPTHYCKYTLIH